ncbi:13368_t:CDS:2 [Gigaspora rosea]|nr:13368_t:CDS:2 [Gigaspora rosea]
MNAGEETSAFCDNPQNYNEEIRETSHLCNNSQKNYNAISKDTVINNDLEKNSTSGNGSDWAAYMNIVCVVAGSGALGIPYALQQGGWISLMFLILAALMSTYTSIKLIECLDHGYKLAYYAFGNIGLCVVGFFFNVISLGCPILYLVLSGDNLQTLFSNYGIDLGMQTWVYICAGTMCIPFIFLKSMKETACFGGNVVYPHIQASMKNKKAWPKVITLAKLTITFMYLLIGIPAYLTYGRNTQSPIYLSLPPGLIVDITTIMITMHILLALPVYQTAFSLELENFLFTNISITLNNTSEFISRTIIRLILVIFTVYVAVTVPYFTNIMALLGALGNGVLIMVTPMLIWIKLFGWDHFKDFKEKIWAIFILIFSLTGAIIGTWDALDALSTQIMGGN